MLLLGPRAVLVARAGPGGGTSGGPGAAGRNARSRPTALSAAGSGCLPVRREGAAASGALRRRAGRGACTFGAVTQP